MAIQATAEAPQNRKTSIPSTMRAAALDRFGGPEVLTIHELPVPTLEANEILIAVHTAGIGPWDADMRGGWWPEGEPTFPLVLGSDGSGTVVDAGRSVRRLAIGDRVYSYCFANAKGGLQTLRSHPCKLIVAHGIVNPFGPTFVASFLLGTSNNMDPLSPHAKPLQPGAKATAHSQLGEASFA